MNTKGTRFLAILAVLAMAFAGFAVFADASGSDAAGGAGAGHPFCVINAVEDAGGVNTTNESMGNMIDMYYQESTNTVYLSGVLSKVVEGGSAGSDQAYMYTTWTALEFNNPVHSARTWMFTIEIYSDNEEGDIVWYEDIYDEKVDTSINFEGKAYKHSALGASKTMVKTFAVKADKGDITFYMSDNNDVTAVNGVEYTISYDFTRSNACLADSDGNDELGITNEQNDGSILFDGKLKVNETAVPAGTCGTIEVEACEVDTILFGNEDLGNNIRVSYDDATKTYKVTGTLAYLDPKLTISTSTYSGLTEDNKYAMAALLMDYGYKTDDGKQWTLGNKHWALVFDNYSDVKDENTYYVTSTGDYLAFNDKGFALYLDSSSIGNKVISFGNAATADGSGFVYHIDLSELQLAESASKNPENAYVMVDNSPIKLAGDDLAGFDISGGSWEYDATTSTLKFINYNGTEAFYTVNGLTVTLEGANSITLSKGAFAIQALGNLEIKSRSTGGDGTLSIEMGNDAKEIDVLSSETGIGINYVGLEILVERSIENSLVSQICAIGGPITSIYHSNVDVEIEEQQGIHEEGNDYYGIYAATVSITGSSDVEVSAGKAIYAADLSIATSVVDADGFFAGIETFQEVGIADNSVVTAKATGDCDLDEFGSGLIFEAGTVYVESGSSIVADSMLSAAKVTVNASFEVNKAIIAGDFVNGPLGKTTFNGSVSLIKSADLINESDDAKESYMVNNGSITTSKINNKDEMEVVFDQIMPTAQWQGKKYFAEVIITDVYVLLDGNAVVIADVLVYSGTNDGENYATETIDTQSGIFAAGKVNKDGALESVTFSVDSENYKIGGDYKTETLNITIAKKVDGTSVSYDISTEGYYFDETGVRQSFEDAKAGSTAHGPETNATNAYNESAVITETDGDSLITVKSGTFTSTGSIYLVNACPELINGATAKFVGNVTSDGALVLVKGEMTGDAVISKGGSFTIGTDASLSGNVSTKGNVTVAGKMTGNVDIQNAITLDVTGSLKGDIATESVNTLNLRSYDGVINYSGKYWSSAAAQQAAKPGDEPDMSFTNSISAKIVGDDSEQTVIKTIASAVATPGVFQIDDIGKVKKDKTSLVQIDVGELKFTTSMEVDPDFVVRANASLPGTIVSIMGKSTKIGVMGSFEVQDGVTLNVYEVDKKYGTIDTEINYNYSGYTYFCGLNYALKNAPEGITINVQKNATGLTGEIAVKKDVIINVNTYTIEFDKNTLLTMGEGAYFDLDTGAAVKFAKSADDTDSKKYNVSGIFVMDGSSVTFEQVKFTDAAEIKAADKLTVTASYDRGTVTALSGDITGALVMGWYLTNPGDEEPVYAAGKFEVGLLSDYYGSVTTDEKCKAKIIINGTFNISNAKGIVYLDAGNVVAVPIIGLGNIELADGQSIKFLAYDEDILNVQLASVTYGENAVSLAGVKADEDITVKAVKATSTKAAYMGFTGAFTEGIVTVYGNAAIDGNSVVGNNDKACGELVVSAGATLSVLSGKTLKAEGLVEVAGTINYKTETVTDYGTLDYQVTYDDAPYTVYTYLSAASENAPAGTVINVDDNLKLTKNTTFSEDITIVIAEDKYIELKEDGYLVIGSGDSLLGALASVSGNIVLNGAKSYVLDFVGSGSDVTVWTDKNMTDLAEDTGIITQENYYAVVYTTTDAAKFKELLSLSTLAKPKIDGYYFGSWVLQNGEKVDDDTMMSDGPFIATLVPAKLSVTFAVVDGVQYYYNNMPVSAPGVTLQLDYDTQITAKALEGYQGLPLVNGKSVYYVHESGVVTATGVTPIPEPPQPEPEPVVGDSGISLTDILLIILVVLIAVMVIILVLRLNRS